MHAAIPALIEGTILLPSLLRLKRREYLEGLYYGQHLSIREISGLAEVNQSTVLDALSRFGIPKNGNGRKHPGQTPSVSTT